MLTLCLLALRGTGGARILHNWSSSSLRFTKDFQAKYGAKVDDGLAQSRILEPSSLPALTRVMAALPAMILFCLRLESILTVAGTLVPKRMESIVIYCDAHLAGFVISLALKGQGATTFTLQHGLYRSEDKGSIMGINNMVSDQILLWDVATYHEFEAAGYPRTRLRIVGQYGFSDPLPYSEVNEDLVLLCPPYDSTRIPSFLELERLLPTSSESQWSLHPMVRRLHPELEQAALSTATPRPALAICGDSGVIMDALCRGIPVITVSERCLTAAHLTYEEVSSLDRSSVGALTDLAVDSLARDQATFGFAVPADQ